MAVTFHPPRVPEADLKAYLDGVVAACEANSFEKMCLWREYTEELKLPWEHNPMGYIHTIGEVGDRPICLSLITTMVNERKILFYNATSQLVDHKMVEDWLDEWLPETPKTDAMNFCNVAIH